MPQLNHNSHPRRAVGGIALTGPKIRALMSIALISKIPHDRWSARVPEFERVMRPGGRLVIMMDMETHEANACLAMRHDEVFPVTLADAPLCPVSIGPAEAQHHHRGNWYEIFGLAWRK